MSHVAIALLCLVAALACLGLAAFVILRGAPASTSVDKSKSDAIIEPPVDTNLIASETEFVPYHANPTAPQTEFVPYPANQAASQTEFVPYPANQAASATAYVPHHANPTASHTEFIPYPANPSAPQTESVPYPANPSAPQTESIPYPANPSAPQTELVPHEAAIETGGTESIPRPIPRAESRTQAMSRAELLAAVQRHPDPTPQAPAIPQVPGTEFISREIILAHQRAHAPRFEPKHVPEPTPPPAAAAPAPAAIGLTTDELEPQLQDAERALARWLGARDTSALEHLAQSFEPALRQALDIVATASDDARTQLLEPILKRRDVDPHLRQVVAVVSLLRNETTALRCIDECLGDAQLVPAMRDVLSWWRGRETDWHLRERARQARRTRTFWLELLEARRIDPGRELLDELLTSDDPEWVLRGLQLAKYHDDPAQRTQIAQSHMHDMRHPARRMAAIELALFDRLPTAWMLCRQLANAPDFPRATELVASLGSARELDPLLRRLERAGGDGLWLLCRSGRKSAATLAARRLQDAHDDELAAVALRYVIGVPLDPTVPMRDIEGLLAHWAACEPKLEPEHRYVHGERIGTPNSVRRCLTSNDDRHHRAFGDELFFRSNGRIRWQGRGFAQDTLAALDGIHTDTIDFTLGPGPA